MRNVLAFLCLVLTSISTEAMQQSPDQVVRALYAWEVGNLGAGWGAGIPDAGELRPVQHLISPRLSSALDRANKKEARCIHKTQQVERQAGLVLKPPLIEGSIFTGSVDGATGVVSVNLESPGPHPRVRVTLENIAKNQPPHSRYWRTEWSVTAVLSSVHGRWVVDDVVGGTDGDDQRLLEWMERYADDPGC